MSLPELTSEERDTYEWQMWVPGLGEEGQRKLKGASVLISRAGGLGGVAALQLAAAGVGRLVIAHGGVVLRSDLNRQLLQTHDDVGQPRLTGIERRLRALNPRLSLELIPENVTAANADRIVALADVVVDAAPLFEERYAMNAAAVRQRKPMIEASMYSMDAHLTTFIPGLTPCLQCVYPVKPDYWKRQFPVIGAVSGTAGALAAMEAIKLICGIGVPLANQLLTIDAAHMTFRKHSILRDPECSVCGSAAPGADSLAPQH